MSKLRVAVVRGGPGHEYDVSLQTGESVLKHLPEHYEARDILVDKSGTWHHGGLPFSPREISRHADVVFNAMHGEYGEDGQVQRLLDTTAVPYTGSGAYASAVGMNKEIAKDIFRKVGLRVPLGKLLRRADGAAATLAKQIFESIPPPWVIKPADRGSSVGLYLAKNFAELVSALEECFKYSDRVLVEEYIKGREATVGVLDHFRDQTHYALPPIEIRRPGGTDVWTYNDKYNGATEEICPGNFSQEEKRELEYLARVAHQALGMRHYSRSDFIISPRGIYLLETNSLPGLTSESLLPKALSAVGCSYPDFLDHVIQLALRR